MAIIVNDALSYAEANVEYKKSFKRLQQINNYTIIDFFLIKLNSVDDKPF